MSLLRVQWLLLKRHTNRCTHTHTHIYLSHLFRRDLGNDGRLNVADGTSHSIQILFFFSTLSRSFKKSVQGQASSVNRAGIWFQIRQQNEGAHEVLSDVRKPSATPGFFFSFLGSRRSLTMLPCRVRRGERGFQASFEFPAWWISKGRSIKQLSVMTGVLMKAPNED